MVREPLYVSLCDTCLPRIILDDVTNKNVSVERRHLSVPHVTHGDAPPRILKNPFQALYALSLRPHHRRPVRHHCEDNPIFRPQPHGLADLCWNGDLSLAGNCCFRHLLVSPYLTRNCKELGGLAQGPLLGNCRHSRSPRALRSAQPCSSSVERGNADAAGGACGGVVTLIQRFGSALNLNVHLHMLVLDGVYANENGKLRFHALPAPSVGMMTHLLDVIVLRVRRWSLDRAATW